jgi:hypothetical protein
MNRRFDNDDDPDMDFKIVFVILMVTLFILHIFERYL